jgi:hypothetical protein
MVLTYIRDCKTAIELREWKYLLPSCILRRLP